jgi:sulfur carrier protein
MSTANIVSGTVVATVNGQLRELPEGTTLAQLVELLGQAPAEVATAINGEFIPRALRGTQVLRSDDRVVCFKPIVGG